MKIAWTAGTLLTLCMWVFAAQASFCSNCVQNPRAPVPYRPVTVPSFPVQPIQVFGPATQAAQKSLTGSVGLMWSSAAPQPGVYSTQYAPGYRLYFPFTYAQDGVTYCAAGSGVAAGQTCTETLTQFLMNWHPDWIEWANSSSVLSTAGLWPFRPACSTAGPPYTNCYPSVDIRNPAVQQFMLQQMQANSIGFQGIGLDNVAAVNLYGAGGHYVGPTDVPCSGTELPSCGGTWVQEYTSSTDPAWITDNVNYLNFLRQNLGSTNQTLLCNTAYEGGASYLLSAQQCTGNLQEGVPQHEGTSDAGSYSNGFVVDTYFQEVLYNAENVSQGWFGTLSYLNGHDTSAITEQEEAYALGWMLLIEQNPAQNYLFAGLDGSIVVEPYPPNMMGGPTSISTTGNTSSSSVDVTSIPSTAGMYPGLSVSGAGIPPGDYIASVVSSTEFALNVTPTASITGNNIAVSGTMPLPIGYPVQAPPAANPYASTPTGACGWVNGANAGVCSRAYSNGWVFINSVCQGSGTSSSCNDTSYSYATITMPTLPGGGAWWDMFCNKITASTYKLYAVDNSAGLSPAFNTTEGVGALVIAYGSTVTCPWPQ